MNPSPEKLVCLWNSAHRIITESGEVSKPAEEHENRIRGQYNQVLNNLTSVSEITAYMFQHEKLGQKDLEHIQQFHSAPIRASEELLNIIMKSSFDVYECFLRSLKETKQHHVYQMLKIFVEQNDYSGHEFVSEHSRLIQRNYVWLTEKLNPDHSLLAVLLGKEVLSGRDYEQISSRKDTFKKNEMLLSLISRKSSVDFKHFQDALNETLQSHINQKLTESAADAECEHRLTTVEKTRTDSWPRSRRKRIPPKIPPKPIRELPVTSAQPKPFYLQGPTVPSRFKPVAGNHHTSTQRNVNMRQVFNVETQFKRLQNELQIEISTKIAVLRHKRSNDNIWKICVEKILHELRQNVESQSRHKALEEKCNLLRQEILQEKSNVNTLQNDIQRQKINTEKQLSVLQESKYDLEASFKSIVTCNEKLNNRLRESELMIDNLKARNKQAEQKAAGSERFLSMQLDELREQLKLSYSEIRNLYQQHKELESKLGKYMNFEEKHQQMSYDCEDGHDALNTDSDLAECCLEELKDKAKYYQPKLIVTESRLTETANRLEESELSLRETEENLKATETKLKATEARLTVAQVSLENIRAEERKAWIEEVDRLFNQLQEQRRLTDELRNKHKSDPILAHEVKGKAAISTKEWIRGLAILDKELFVVNDESSEVQVYNSMKFGFSHKWNLKELISALDIGSCNRHKCLYILQHKGNYRTREILRVAPNGKLINKWSAENSFGESLSVSDESNVILTALQKNKLNEYSPDGKLIREIDLSSDGEIIHPLHAIKLSNGHYLVSHGWIGNERNLVCVVDADGKRTKSLGGKFVSTIGKTTSPVYLAVDRNESVMVVDQGNSRVLLLDTNLEFKTEILSKEKHGLRGPCRILFDESNYQLFVADNQRDEGRILVFEFIQ